MCGPAIGAPGEIHLTVPVGEFRTVTPPADILRIAVAAPEVADYSVISKREALISGKSAGSTTVKIWMPNETITYLVTVRKTPRQVRMHVRVMEISENAGKTQGIDWGSFRHSGAPDVSSPPGAHDQYALSGSFASGLLPRVMNFKRSQAMTSMDPFMLQINYLIDSGVIRILSEPEIVALSGGRSDVLIGGQVPIPLVTQNQMSVEWKDYGIKMSLEPNIDDDHRITAKVYTEVSTLDFTNAVSQSGFLLPALKITRAASEISVEPGKTVFLSGLKREINTQSTRGVPGLSALPMLGKLFSNSVDKAERVDLIISVTPYIVRGEGG
ncbi:pilus assembly protein N-terminal domain-containing protein [bacterium]|nr:pilus assembly protein N-terminal domain-containing protein [bacterium]